MSIEPSPLQTMTRRSGCARASPNPSDGACPIADGTKMTSSGPVPRSIQSRAVAMVVIPPPPPRRARRPVPAAASGLIRSLIRPPLRHEAHARTTGSAARAIVLADLTQLRRRFDQSPIQLPRVEHGLGEHEAGV